MKMETHPNLPRRGGFCFLGNAGAGVGKDDDADGRR